MRMCCITAILLAVAAVAQQPVPSSPQKTVDTTFAEPAGGKRWLPKTAADLTAALNSSLPGDVIVLPAGTTFSGNFVLAAKPNPLKKWIYIESSALGALAAGARVGPADAAKMPKLVTPNAAPALSPAPGADHWRIAGVEITSSSSSFTWFAFGWQSDSTTLPDSITLDRCYIHGSPTVEIGEGVQANISNFALVDSYVSDIHHSTFDSQAVVAYWTPGPLKLQNNFLSATTEDVMFGGGGGYANPFVPSDIQITGNHFYKPTTWDSCGTGGTVPPGSPLADGTLCPPSPSNQWAAKNNLEFKSARRVTVRGNTFENSWRSGQVGYSVLFTPRTTQSGANAVVDDILLESNLLIGGDYGFSTLASDNGCTSPCSSAGEARRITLKNNLVLLSPRKDTNGGHNGLQLATNLTDFVFQHNTVAMADGSPLSSSLWFSSNQSGCPPTGTDYTHNVWVLDNVLLRQPYGDCYSPSTNGLAMLGVYMPDPAKPDITERFRGNVLYALAGDAPNKFPAFNTVVTTAPTWVNAAAGNYQLATPPWTQTSDGKLAGIDYAALSSALGGSGSGGDGGGGGGGGQTPPPSRPSAETTYDLGGQKYVVTMGCEAGCCILSGSSGAAIPEVLAQGPACLQKLPPGPVVAAGQ